MFNLGLYSEFRNYRNKYSHVMHTIIGYKEFFEYSAHYNKNIENLGKADLGKIAWRIKKNSKKLALNQINALKKMRDVKSINGVSEIEI